jgi:hypothetical protein
MDELQPIGVRLSGSQGALLEAWNSMIRHPTDALLDLLASETERRTCVRVDRANAELFLTFLRRWTPRCISENSVQVSTNYEGPNAFEKVSWVEVNGDRLQVPSSHWRDAVIAVCDKISRENRADFALVLNEVWSGGRRKWFSRIHVELDDGRPIAGTDIYVATGLSANNSRELCDGLCRKFGYGTFQVEYMR